MSCEKYHEELLNFEEEICPFCEKELYVNTEKTEQQCCNRPEIVYGSSIVCKNCGSVLGYKQITEFIDFYENKHRFYRKSVYQRKYHILNIINNIAAKNGFQITVKNRDKILRIFDEIGKVVKSVNIDRKRMININFILKQIFRMLDLPYEKVKTSKSKKTLEKYKLYWKDILSLASDKIDAIVKE